MRQLADLSADTRRRAIIAATICLLVVLWLEVVAIRYVSAPNEAEQAMRSDDRLYMLRYTMGYLDVATALEALRGMSVLGLPLGGITLAKPGQHAAAQAADWNPAHPTARTWLEDVHEPLKISDVSADPKLLFGGAFFRGACWYGIDDAKRCPADPMLASTLAQSHHNFYRQGPEFIRNRTFSGAFLRDCLWSQDPSQNAELAVKYILRIAIYTQSFFRIFLLKMQKEWRISLEKR